MKDRYVKLNDFYIYDNTEHTKLSFNDCLDRLNDYERLKNESKSR